MPNFLLCDLIVFNVVIISHRFKEIMIQPSPLLFQRSWGPETGGDLSEGTQQVNAQPVPTPKCVQ